MSVDVSERHLWACTCWFLSKARKTLCQVTKNMVLPLDSNTKMYEVSFRRAVIFLDPELVVLSDEVSSNAHIKRVYLTVCHKRIKLICKTNV